MKAELQALVVRYHNKPILVSSIADGYTEVNFHIPGADFDNTTKIALQSCQEFIVSIVTDGYIFNNNDAYTVCGTYGNLTIAIEKFAIDII